MHWFLDASSLFIVPFCLFSEKPYEICSMSESMALKLASTCSEDFVNHNKRFLTRIYPNGMRVDSSNYNPQDLWNCGCQVSSRQRCWSHCDLSQKLFLFVHSSKTAGCRVTSNYLSTMKNQWLKANEACAFFLYGARSISWKESLVVELLASPALSSPTKLSPSFKGENWILKDDFCCRFVAVSSGYVCWCQVIGGEYWKKMFGFRDDGKEDNIALGENVAILWNSICAVLCV